MTRTITIQDLPSLTREILAQIAPDEEIIVEDQGHPVVRITPVPPAPVAKPAHRQLGLLKGQVWVAPDFDDELPDDFWFSPNDPLNT